MLVLCGSKRPQQQVKNYGSKGKGLMSLKSKVFFEGIFLDLRGRLILLKVFLYNSKALSVFETSLIQNIQFPLLGSLSHFRIYTSC